MEELDRREFLGAAMGAAFADGGGEKGSKYYEELYA